MIGAVLALAGSLVALWLVRENEIERDQPELAISREQELEAIAA